MPDLSQRTLAHLMDVLESLTPEDADNYSGRQEFWQKILFKWGFPEWLIDYATGTSHTWTTIIRDLFAGRVTENLGGHSIYHVPREIQEQMLRGLTAMAITESEDTDDTHQLRLSLQLDGFDVADGKTVPIEGPISVTQEKSRLLTNLEASSFARTELIARHLKDADDLFSEGKMHPAMGEARSAFQAAVEDTVSLVERTAKSKSGSGLKNQIEFLANNGFFSPDEQQAFLAAWGFLSAGAHPGLPQDEAGRVGFVLGLEFMQVLLIKAKNLI